MKNFYVLILLGIHVSFYAQVDYPKNYFGLPLDIPLLVSGTFGELRDNHLHSGIDFKTQKRDGFPVYATADGYVSRIRVSLYGFGKVVYLNHPNGYTTVYAHLLKFAPTLEKYVKNEQYKKSDYEVQLFPKSSEYTVKKGDLIGYSGSTGGFVDPHLHYEIRDTKSEKPINPLHFGMSIKDTINPIIKEVIVYPRTNETQISQANFPYHLNLKKTKNGWLETEKITASGVIGIGINAHDLLNGSNNENGIYSLELFVNGGLYHQQKFDLFSFDETKYLNLLIDYGHYITTNKRIHKAFIDLNNPLSVINSALPGTIVIKPGFSYKIEVVATDFSGNATKVIIPIEGKLDAVTQFKPQLTTNYFIKATEFQKFTLQNVTVAFPKNTFYEDTYLQFEVSKDQAVVHQPTVPLDKNYTLTFNVSHLTSIDKQQSFIGFINKKNKIEYEKTSKKDSIFYTSTKSLGTFKLMKDSIPPTIELHNIKPHQWISKLAVLEVIIDDDLSGIDTYTAEINGNWILMEYHLKRKMLTFDFSDVSLKGHQHQLKITVTDKVGNTNLLETTFYRIE